MGVRLNSAGDIAAFLALHPDFVAALKTVEQLRRPDAWIAAGCIRNAVWDALHNRPYKFCAGDVDVVYFDADCASPEADYAIESALRAAMPDLDWSVKNQARMHLKNGDAPYTSTLDAMLNWPEVCTAIGARFQGEKIEILAPFGVDDLLSLRVRPTPAFAAKLDVFWRRVAGKNWRERWPLLKISSGRNTEN